MKMNFVLAKIWGVPVGIHFSWLIIFALLMFSLATGMLPGALPTLPLFGITLVALATTLLFFGSVLAHELGHVFVALRNRIPVRGISLFIFGGVAQIEKEPESAGAEFRIAAAGPLVSFLLAGLFFALAQLPFEFIAFPASWLARINLILGLFNLLPGFPLDGGRIFRALVWKLTGSAYRSTKIAAITGQGVAFAMIGLGLFNAFSSSLANGLWLAFIGWFLLNAASGSLAYASLQQRLSGIPVSQVMRREVPQVPSFLTLSSLVQQYVLGLGKRAMVVGDATGPVGLITLAQISQVGRARWSMTTTAQAMTPLQELPAISPETPLSEALSHMTHRQLELLPVVVEGQVVGLVSQEDVLRLVETRQRLKLG
jgi:Zn-dependent protease/predicted transcriptional regulator